jgi:RNA polymerase sigma-B factor
VGGSTTFAELVPDEDDPFERVDQWQTLAPVMAGLDERERQILVLRFVFRYTQDRIGAEIGVSQMQVSRLLRGVLQKLRQQLEPRHEPEPGPGPGPGRS